MKKTKKKKKTSRLAKKLTMDDMREAPAGAGRSAPRKAKKKIGRLPATREKLTSVSVPVSLAARLQRHAFDRAQTARKPPLWEVIRDAMDALEKGQKRKR